MTTCPVCEQRSSPEILRCPEHGFYIGTQCRCGPLERLSIFYDTYTEADTRLINDTWKRKEN